jgi:hypothetical protein
LVRRTATGTPPEAASAAKRSSRRGLRLRQRLGDEREIDVDGQHLAVGCLAGVAADDRAVARLDGGDRVAVVELDPVAGDRRLGQPPAGGNEPRLVVI